MISCNCHWILGWKHAEKRFSLHTHSRLNWGTQQVVREAVHFLACFPTLTIRWTVNWAARRKMLVLRYPAWNDTRLGAFSKLRREVHTQQGPLTDVASVKPEVMQKFVALFFWCGKGRVGWRVVPHARNRTFRHYRERLGQPWEMKEGENPDVPLWSPTSQICELLT
jgi:hypothetical protein